MSDKSNIPYFRARTQRSGTIYYYVLLPGLSRRQEIAVGSDLDKALSQRSSIIFQYFCDANSFPTTAQCVLHWYLLIVVPLRPPQARRENTASIQKLMRFMEEIKATSLDPIYLKIQYGQWADPRLTFRTRRECALLLKIFKWYELMKTR